MTRPSDFILTSDYATLKNDAIGTVSVTLPSTLNIAAASTTTFTSSVTIGVPGSSFRARILSTTNNVMYASTSIFFSRTSGATVSGSPVGYDVFVSVHRTSPTEISMTAFIPNQYGATMSITTGLSMTITAHIATFLPPFT